MARKEAEEKERQEFAIPQYPGRQIDPKGAASVLTKSVHDKMHTI